MTPEVAFQVAAREALYLAVPKCGGTLLISGARTWNAAQPWPPAHELVHLARGSSAYTYRLTVP